MKLIIKESQLKKLLESDLSFHIGNLPDDKIPYYNLRDTLYMISSSRHTGHFGTGTYLSTYKDREFYDLLNKGDYKDAITHAENRLYIIDLDRYNLYKPKNDKHAEFLFKTLKLINSLIDYNNKLVSDYKITIRIILNNFKYLNLKFPKPREFKQIVDNLGKDNHASLSTLIMEYNGYNGVNVNNIPIWDSTLHGSVIYDLNKVDYEKLTPRNIDTLFTKIDNHFIHDYDNPSPYSLNISNFNKIPLEKINYYINLLDKPIEHISFLDDYIEDKEKLILIKKSYLHKLKKLIKSGAELDNSNLEFLINNNQYDFILKNIDTEDLLYIIAFKLPYLEYPKEFLKKLIEISPKNEDTKYPIEQIKNIYFID